MATLACAKTKLSVNQNRFFLSNVTGAKTKKKFPLCGMKHIPKSPANWKKNEKNVRSEEPCK